MKWSRRVSIENGSAGLVSSTSRLRSITFARPDGVVLTTFVGMGARMPQRGSGPSVVSVVVPLAAVIRVVPSAP